MIDVVMPKFGLTMTEGLITHWHHRTGDVVKQGQILFDVETDKVTTEVEAAVDGTLAEILFPEGAVVSVGQAVARFSCDDLAPAQGEDGPAARKLMSENGISRASLTGTGRGGRVMKEDVLRVIATPYARRLAREGGIDLATVTGSRSGGRIKAVDVQQAVPERTEPSVATLTQPDAVRLTIARRVQSAKRDIPHFYMTRHVDIRALESLRQTLNGASAGRVKISVTHMLVKAAGLALARHAQMNCVWLPDGILTLATVGVGIVTETPVGLRIPVLDKADSLVLDDVAAECAGLVARARSGALIVADVSGGAISVSNVGMFGAHSLTPIISPPQAMMLGVGAAQQVFRPDAAGQPVLHKEIVLTLAADHRLIDGASAARFLGTIAQILESPFDLLRAPPARANATDGVTDEL
ncbi:MAG: dihydrolipoamide acetyltransferase family protein [Gemmobacter sp.]|nr:dihydrolipoamide acetyltransferase family protein [Gemmobacter sp.]